MKTIFKTLFVCMLCSMSFVANAQVRFTVDQGVVLGGEKYTPLTLGKAWSIEEFEGGLNIWRRWPEINYGNYKMFIDANGNMGIGKKPSSHKLEVNGSAWVTGSYLTSSDVRLKSDIRNLSMCLDKIKLLSGKSYIKKSKPILDKQGEVNKLIKCGKIKACDSDKVLKSMSDQNSGELNKREYGFIAQDVKEVFPDLVFEDKDGYLSINYNGLIPILVEAFKEQKKIVEIQTAEIKEMVSKMSNM